MDSIKKKNIEKLLLIISALALLAILLPVFRLSKYAVMYYDDYNYAYHVREAYESGASVLGIIASAFEVSAQNYNSWQGTFSSSVFMALTTGTYGMEYYYIGIVFLISMYVVANVYLGYVIARCLGKADRVKSFIFAFLITFVNVMLFYQAQQGIYWHNGATHYTLMHSFFLMLVAAGIRLTQSIKTSSKVFHMITMSILGVLCSGSNFITTLYGLAFLAAFVVFLMICRNKNYRYALLPLVLNIIGSYFNITAPGNAHRQAYFTSVAKGPVESVLLSLKSGVERFNEFTGLRFWSLMIVMLPVVFLIVKDMKFKFGYPLLVTVLSYGVYCTGFAPSWYGMGIDGLARNFCVLKTNLVFLIVFNIGYWMGYILRRFFKASEDKNYLLSLFIPMVAGAALFVFSFAISDNQAGNFMPYGAYYYVHTGEALNYYNEHVLMAEAINECGEDAVVQQLVWHPWFLWKIDEIDTNPNAEQNQAMARWFGKRSIVAIE